jgi:nitrile hydratase
MHDHTHAHAHDHSHGGGGATTYHGRPRDEAQALLHEHSHATGEAVPHTAEDGEVLAPSQGARVVAHAWVDPAFKARLVADAKAAISEIGIDVAAHSELIALENTDRAHNVVVCTLCSCYPTALLGAPPAWYKSLSYRTRMIADPRGVLKEFGLEVAPNVELRVHDSTAQTRYIVIPTRPAGTEGMGEEDLAALVTRDSMIGADQARKPDAR